MVFTVLVVGDCEFVGIVAWVVAAAVAAAAVAAAAAAVGCQRFSHGCHYC